MTTTLFRGGPIWGPGLPAGAPAPTALVMTGGAVEWVGGAEQAGSGADAVVELAGRLLLPAFVDAHLHMTAAGLALTTVDLTSRVSLRDVLQAVEAWATAHPGELLLGTGWDESAWPERRRPTGAELDRATGGAPVYLARTDVHSAVVSAALLARAPEAAGLPGWEADGFVRWEAHHALRRVAYEQLPAATRARAQQAVRDECRRLGVGTVHEMAGPEISSAQDLTGLLTHQGPGPRVLGYWGEPGEAGVARALALGAVSAGGDLFVDGALGSHTACLRRAYDDAPGGAGLLRFGPDEVADHLLACQRAGIAGGFHVIGDAALDAVLAGAREVARQTSLEAVRAAGHRLEHVEMTDDAAVAALVELGLTASVQPVFDEFWGGPDGVYAQRLGQGRAAGMNRFADLLAAGVPVVFSSDAPVTPLDPWRAVRAAVTHRTPGQRISAEQAVTAHTRAGWQVAGHPTGGTLVPGAPADLALWRLQGPSTADGLPVLPDGPDPTCEGLWVAGEPVLG